MKKIGTLRCPDFVLFHIRIQIPDQCFDLLAVGTVGDCRTVIFGIILLITDGTAAHSGSFEGWEHIGIVLQSLLRILQSIFIISVTEEEGGEVIVRVGVLGV